MYPTPAWQFNEMQQVGVNYTDLAEVEKFDAFHRQFRNIEKENAAIIALLDIQKQHTIIDFGAGTGAFAIQAAAVSKQVYAVDISRGMLDYAAKKSGKNGISNIQFCHGGFLSYAHKDAPVDFVVTSLALHHLPDFWKGVALQKMHALLKPAGRLFIADVVYSGTHPEEDIARWMTGLEQKGGHALVEDAQIHVREEYSTQAWIMEGLLETAGFEIEKADYDQGIFAQYLCRKKPAKPSSQD